MTDAVRHRAVILARGASRRMGFPKGLARRPGSEWCFLESVLALYDAAGIPALVICGPDGAAAYGPIVGRFDGAQWLAAESGAGTARTVGLALERMPERDGFLWAHPVDVPDVGEATLGWLIRQAGPPDRGHLRPEFAGAPGHPVGLAVGWLRKLDRALGGEGEGQGLRDFPGSMAAALRTAPLPPLRCLPVRDPAVTRDYDDVEELHDSAE